MVTNIPRKDWHPIDGVADPCAAGIWSRPLTTLNKIRRTGKKINGWNMPEDEASEQNIVKYIDFDKIKLL